jgi:hypothetical protein
LKKKWYDDNEKCTTRTTNTLGPDISDHPQDLPTNVWLDGDLPNMDNLEHVINFRKFPKI